MLKTLLKHARSKKYVIILPVVLLMIMSAPVVANIASANDEDETGGNETRDLCSFQSGVDNPHLSRNRTDVSGHGWWRIRAGTCPTHARVKSWLYQ